MKVLKENLGGIIVCLFEILVGVLLLINPIGFTSAIIVAFGIVLLAVGILSIVKYFRQEPKEAMAGKCLTKGLIALLCGCFCTFQSQWFIVTFPVLTIIYGIIILVTGLAKVQAAADLVRIKNNKWFLAAISAVISIICAVVILRNPFTSTSVLWIFTAVTLIVESIIDLVTLLLSATDGNKA